MYKVKILLVGPCQSGKTMIANFVARAHCMAFDAKDDVAPTEAKPIRPETEARLIRSGRIPPACQQHLLIWDATTVSNMTNDQVH